MASRYPIFERARLRLRPLEERRHDVEVGDLLPLDTPVVWSHPRLSLLAERIREARARSAARVLMMGAHVIKSGASRHIVDLLERGAFTHIALNGAGMIHDYELARIGATSESVARYIRSGEFGMWRETGVLNDWIAEAAGLGLGLGENIGRRIIESGFPHAGIGILAAAFRLSIPATVHVGIGYDIIHAHPNCHGAALGAASYRDFLIFAQSLETLEGGVLVRLGSAVMAPQVFQKALAMVRNASGKARHFTSAVFDLVPRTVPAAGESLYLQGDHRATVPALRAAL